MNTFKTLASSLLVMASLGLNTAHAGATYELNIGSLAPKGTPWMDLLEQMEKDIEEGSNGQIDVIIRPTGVMGEIEMVRETRKGDRLQAAAVTTAALAEGGNIPLLQLVELPIYSTIRQKPTTSWTTFCGPPTAMPLNDVALFSASGPRMDGVRSAPK